jgi:hypothetical protein
VWRHWHLAYNGTNVSALIIDGLGHGEDAERAAKAGEQVFAQSPFASPVLLMEDMHRDMIGSRGVLPRSRSSMPPATA